MRRLRALHAVAALTAWLCACTAAHAGITPSLSAECAFLNKYLWRGSVLTPGAVAQPSMTLGLGMLDEGHNDVNYGTSGNGPTDLEITFSSDLSLTHLLTVRPMVGYARLIDGDLRDATKGPDNVLFGLSVVTGF